MGGSVFIDRRRESMSEGGERGDRGRSSKSVKNAEGLIRQGKGNITRIFFRRQFFSYHSAFFI